MKRKLLFLMTMILPVMAMAQGVITLPGNSPEKASSKGKRNSSKKQKTSAQPAQDTKTGKSSRGNSISIIANGITFHMVKVTGGTFTMGATPEQEEPSSDEKPAHQVKLSSYYIGETEVTQALWKAVMGDNPSAFMGDDLPVEKVSWKDCHTFIGKLSRLTKRRFRLPTEAEWEFAARGGNKSSHTQYSGSSNIDRVAWFESNSGRQTHPVKSKKANELGIYDMSGNVSEWCEDWKGGYNSESQNNPAGLSNGIRRVCRGGSWDVNASNCRVSARNCRMPIRSFNYTGLRLVLSE